MKDMTKESNYNDFSEDEKSQLKLLEAAAIMSDFNMDEYWIESDESGVTICWDAKDLFKLNEKVLDSFCLCLTPGMININRIIARIWELGKTTSFWIDGQPGQSYKIPRDLNRWVNGQFDDWLEENREDDEEDVFDYYTGQRM